jgi:hypothetical protein
MNAFFVATLSAYRQELNNGITNELTYLGNPCIYGVFDAYTNKYIIALEEINRYSGNCDYNGGTATIIPPDCDYNGGTAVIQYDCNLTAGSAILIAGNCNLIAGSAILQ